MIATLAGPSGRPGRSPAPWRTSHQCIHPHHPGWGGDPHRQEPRDRGKGVRTMAPHAHRRGAGCGVAERGGGAGPPGPRQLLPRRFAGGSNATPTDWLPMRRGRCRGSLDARWQPPPRRWGVPAFRSAGTQPGVVVHAASGQRIGYGEDRGAGAPMPVPDPETIPPEGMAAELSGYGTSVHGWTTGRSSPGSPLTGSTSNSRACCSGSSPRPRSSGGKVAQAHLDERWRAAPGVRSRLRGGGRRAAQWTAGRGWPYLGPGGEQRLVGRPRPPGRGSFR